MIEDKEYATEAERSPTRSEPPTKKRKRNATVTPRKGKGKVPELTAIDDAQIQSPPSKRKEAASPRKTKDEEKRLRRFRQHAPSSYVEKLNRATTQR